jgi:hypothetical protein
VENMLKQRRENPLPMRKIDRFEQINHISRFETLEKRKSKFEENG